MLELLRHLREDRHTRTATEVNGVRDNLSANSSKHFAMGAFGHHLGRCWLVVLRSVTIWVLLVRLVLVVTYSFAG